jgi:hypothetical protein
VKKGSGSGSENGKWGWRYTVRKVNTTLRRMERIPKTQILIARTFTLQALSGEACKFTL